MGPLIEPAKNVGFQWLDGGWAAHAAQGFVGKKPAPSHADKPANDAAVAHLSAMWKKRSPFVAQHRTDVDFGGDELVRAAQRVGVEIGIA